MPESLASLMRQQLPAEAISLLQHATAVADRLGYALYLVGGTVRDLLLSIPTADLDLTVEGDGVRMARGLSDAVGGKVTARSPFGTARVLAGDFVVDVATARRERYPEPGALPVVIPSTLEEDLYRRDFTINAMAVALGGERWGELIDLNGGSTDLHARQMRILHSASFQDDPTRMVRALRYGHRLDFQIEAHTEFILRRDAAGLGLVGGPRRWKELQRLLDEPSPEGALLWAESLGLLPQLHHALHADRWLADTFAAARSMQQAGLTLSTVYLCILAFRMSSQEQAELIAEFQLPAAKSRALQDMGSVMEHAPRLSEPGTKPSMVVQALQGVSLAALQACSVATDQPILRETLQNYLKRWRNVRPLLAAKHVISMGVPIGPALGERLAALRAARLDGLSATVEQEETLVRSWLAAHGA